MLAIRKPPARQMLLRLPEHVAMRLSRATLPRQRNQFIVDLVSRELDKEDADLVASCEFMNAIEAKHPELVQEALEWDNANLMDDDNDEFDPETFEREFAIAQAKMHEAKAKKKVAV
jgi:hypothetical protein